MLDHGDMRLRKYDVLSSLIQEYPAFDAFLIDMAIGLRNSTKEIRPDDEAKKELGPRASTVFPIPSRDAVYAVGEENQKLANIRTLGKSLAKQSIAIIPKIKELDIFLNDHPEYKNKILESHPEVDFARLNGAVLMSRKKEEPGPSHRIDVLSEFLDKKELFGMYDKAKELHCNQDDLIDAICLAVTGALYAHGEYETIPVEPKVDEKGLLMQLIVPKKRNR